MTRRSFIIIPLLALLPAFARAAEPLPDRVYGDDMNHVIVIDLTRFNFAQSAAAAKTLFGEDTEVMGLVNPVLSGLKAMQGPIDAGMLRMVQGVPRQSPGQYGPPFIYTIARPGAEKSAKDAMGKLFGNAARFEAAGAWTRVVFGRDPATRPVAARTGPLADALAIAGDPPLTWVILPNDTTRKELGGEVASLPAPLRDVLSQSLAGRYVAITITLGDAPALQTVAAMPDDASATRLEAAIAALAGNPQLAPFKAMLEQAKPQRDGAIVRVSLDTANLAAITKAASPMLKAASEAQARQQRRASQPLPEPAVSAAAAQMRLLLAQIKTFDEQKGRLPNDLDELLNSGLVPDSGIYEMMNPRTMEERGFIYSKPAGATRLSDIKTPATTPLLREALDGQAAPDSMTGFADGHVELFARAEKK